MTTSPARRMNLPNSCRRRAVLEIPNRDHMLAVGDRVYKAGVLKFLQERP